MCGSLFVEVFTKQLNKSISVEPVFFFLKHGIFTEACIILHYTIFLENLTFLFKKLFFSFISDVMLSEKLLTFISWK